MYNDAEVFNGDQDLTKVVKYAQKRIKKNQKVATQQIIGQTTPKREKQDLQKINFAQKPNFLVKHFLTQQRKDD